MLLLFKPPHNDLRACARLQSSFAVFIFMTCHMRLRCWSSQCMHAVAELVCRVYLHDTGGWSGAASEGAADACPEPREPAAG